MSHSSPKLGTHFTRRSLLQSGLGIAAAGLVTKETLAIHQHPELESRVRGLLLGTILGDAVGGPVEFQDVKRCWNLPVPTKSWAKGELLDESGIRAARERIALRSYKELRPVPESYGHWTHNAEPGTITDDSRHKMVFMHMLRKARQNAAWPISDKDMAHAYLDWPETSFIRSRPDYATICKDWLYEFGLSAKWTLGERNLKLAKPSERMWGSLPTCCGQMILPPLAAVYPGDSLSAYQAAYGLSFFDNGYGKDMNAALIAGLSRALVVTPSKNDPRACWEEIYAAMRYTDPYSYGDIPWTWRSVDRWLDVALKIARESERQPAKLYERLYEEFKYSIKWEAQVPFVVIFASLEFCNYDPLAAMQIGLEWGEDTDSYAQLLGAFVGAIYGEDLIPSAFRKVLTERMKLDYGEDLDEWTRLLVELSADAKTKKLFDHP